MQLSSLSLSVVCCKGEVDLVECRLCLEGGVGLEGGRVGEWEGGLESGREGRRVGGRVGEWEGG